MKVSSSLLAACMVACAGAQAYPQPYLDASMAVTDGIEPNIAGLITKTSHFTNAPTERPTQEWDGENAQGEFQNGAYHGHDDSVGNTLVNQATHQHTDDHENYQATTNDGTTGKVDTVNTELARTAYPTAAPTAFPTYHYDRNGGVIDRCTDQGIHDVGQKFGGLGNNYCKQYVCVDTAQGYVSQLVDPALANYDCGDPNLIVAAGANNAECQNVDCEYDAVDNVIKVKHMREQLAFEGGVHNCRYQERTNVCKCGCSGNKAPVWHSYEDWYCATNGGNGANPQHIGYRSPTEFHTKHPTFMPGGDSGTVEGTAKQC